MKAKIYDSFKEPITDIDIDRIEYYIHLLLPQTYKQFLKKNNGGRPEPNNFKTNSGEIISQVQFFFGVTPNVNYDLKSKFDYFANNYSDTYLPIANDVIGNIIVIDLKNNYGHVYLWLHDVLDNELVLIANSFDEFFQGFFKNELGNSEIDLAIERQDINYFDAIINAGNDINSILNEFNQRVVIAAALKNKVRLLKYFYSKGAAMDLALISAASNGNYGAVKYLVSLNLNVDERDPQQNNDTPLIQAAYGGYKEVVEELIKAGADINAKDNFNQSVLTKASWSGKEDLVSFLKGSGAN